MDIFSFFFFLFFSFFLYAINEGFFILRNVQGKFARQWWIFFSCFIFFFCWRENLRKKIGKKRKTRKNYWWNSAHKWSCGAAWLLGIKQLIIFIEKSTNYVSKSQVKLLDKIINYNHSFDKFSKNGKLTW